jgi:carboxylate-amine ligase
MPERFTLGIEQEFQLVDRQTGDLCSCIDAIRAQGEVVLGEKMKP